jgi:hypothetical protein
MSCPLSRLTCAIIASSSGSFRLDARGLDHLAPFSDFFGEFLLTTQPATHGLIAGRPS